MSYNVTAFTIKKLDGLTMPYAKLLKMTDGRVTIDGETHTFDDFEVSSMEVCGSLNGDRLEVSSIDYRGEFSGSYWDEFETLLQSSQGVLRVLVVWECGDTVEIMDVKDGVIDREDV